MNDAFEAMSALGMRHMFIFKNIRNSTIRVGIPLRFFRAHLTLPDAQNEVIDFFAKSLVDTNVPDEDGPLDTAVLHRSGYIGAFSMTALHDCEIEIIVIPNENPWVEIIGEKFEG